MTPIFREDFGLKAAQTFSKGLLAVFMAFTPAAAKETMPAPNEHEADIILSYGSNVGNDVQRQVLALNDRGINAIAFENLDDPNCVALIFDGEERYRYQQASINNGRLGATVVRLVNGDRIGRRAASDCPSL